MCQGQNKNSEGEHFCADCSDYYCSSCIKVHNVVPALKNHKILNKAQFQQPSSSVQFPAVPTERCRVHGHKPVDMFCQQHDSVGCSTCMVVQHSDCKEKFYVPDYIKNNNTADNLNNITVQMDAIANSLADLQKEFIKEKEDVRSSKEKSLKQIKNWRNQINGLLDKLEDKTVRALEQRFQYLTDKIETCLGELQATTTDIQSAQDSFKSAGGNMAQMFVSIKMANEVASLAQEKVNTTQSKLSSTEMSFIPHQGLQSILKEMQALGEISIIYNIQSKTTVTGYLQQETNDQTINTSSKTPFTTASLVSGTVTETSNSQSTTAPLLPVAVTKTSHTSSNSQSTTATLLPVTKKQTSHKSPNSQSTTAPLLPVTKTRTRQQSYSQSKPSLLQVKGKISCKVKVKSDSKTCFIISACTLADGTIILADQSNCKLKCVNTTSFTITDYCEIPVSPWQVCSITDQEVAVSCGYSKLIQFVSIGRTIKKIRRIYTGFSCFALAYADGKLFVSDPYTSVYVYSVYGNRQQHFSKDQSGQQIFSDIRSIAVSSDHSKIYVADYNKGLIILDRTGQLVGQFNGPELKGANAVCLYKEDNILIYYSGNVLQFGPDGKLLGEVLKTGKYCRSVWCNKDNTKLRIVGLLPDEIEVYDIN